MSNRIVLVAALATIGACSAALGATTDAIRGTPKADRLQGTAAADRIYGLDGADRIEGHGGSDVIYGGPGNDRLSGGPGKDVLVGGGGSDRVYGAFADKITCGLGDDFVFVTEVPVAERQAYLDQMWSVEVQCDHVQFTG